METTSKNKKRVLLENLFMVVLVFYPLRHVNWGLDLWDTGYSYANFTFAGLKHMDPMWLFSTWLANVAGNMLTRLPHGGTLVGMNFYTGLFVSVLALAGYFFCTRSLKMPAGIVFIGEFAAESLCWCPTAVLYNYLSYVLFLAAVILLYQGLTKEKRVCLAAAGVCLGSNVLVRFSNLPQAAMILAVWAYDVILWREDKKTAQKGKASDPFWPRLLRHTGWCLAGYLGALALLLGDIHMRFGIGQYIQGIRNLFAMTENATDYKAGSMLGGLINAYRNGMYWAVRMAVILAGGIVLFVLAGIVEKVLAGGEDDRSRPLWRVRASGLIHVAVRVLWTAVCIAMVVWLYVRKFCSFTFYSYDSMLYPGILFLMLTMLVGVIRIFDPHSPREEKLISGMLILVVLLTSIGSNNNVYPSINNLFAAAPYTLWESWRFIRGAGERRLRISGRRFKKHHNPGKSEKAGLQVIISSFPVKGMLTAFLALCLLQFSLFGAVFVFSEGTGVQDAEAYVENNEVLKNVRMSAERARWMSEISAYVEENNLQGREVLLYGNIPALSFYLQMPAAFQPWSDLRSYSAVRMQADMERMEEEMLRTGSEGPVVIVENKYGEDLEQSRVLETGESSPLMEQDAKWSLIVEFMNRQGYQQTFRSEKFAVYRKVY